MYYILHNSNGELVGVTNEETWVSLPGVSIIFKDGPIPNLNQLKWNKLTLAFESNYLPLSKFEFMSRFTAEERIAIHLSTDPMVKDYIHLLELAQEIDVKNKITIDGLNYLASIDVLTTERVVEILA